MKVIEYFNIWFCTYQSHRQAALEKFIECERLKKQIEKMQEELIHLREQKSK